MHSLMVRDDLPLLVVCLLVVVIALAFIALMYIPGLDKHSGKVRPRRTTRSDHWKTTATDSAEYD